MSAQVKDFIISMLRNLNSFDQGLTNFKAISLELLDKLPVALR